jgi:hypothetical protein
VKAAKSRVLLLCLFIALALVVAIRPLRHFLLRIPGQALVIPAPNVQSADIIVIAVDANGAGVLQAADLVHAGISHRVAVFADPPSAVDREFLRRGLPYYDAAAVSTQQLQQLGINDIENIPRSVTGSEDEGRLLPTWCAQAHLKSVVLVVNADHSRRLQRILRRAMKGRPESVIVFPSRYTDFDPNAWWQTRGNARTEIEEFQKLTWDFIRHPLS